MTGWTLPQVMALTFPQFTFILEGAGPILFPRLKPTLDAQFAQLSSKAESGKESDTAKIIREDAERRAQLAAGLTPKPTAEQLERSRAYAVLYGYYTGETDAEVTPPDAQPIPGLPAATAQAIVEYAAAGGFATPELSPIWSRDVIPWWLQIQATAGQE